MPPSETLGARFGPVRMQRVAIVAPRPVLRDALVRVGDAGCVQLDAGTDPSGTGARDPAVDAVRDRLHRLGSGPARPALSATEPDLDELERACAADLLAGEGELAEHAAAAVRHGLVAGLLGWCPEPDTAPLATRLAEVGAALVPLPAPRGVDPPSQLTQGTVTRRSFATLVSTYGTVPYPDVDPTLLAGLAYVLMFGMMFGDAGHGLLLLAAGLAIRSGRPRRWAGLHGMWPFVVGAGLTSTSFGVLYGEFFGPTALLPVVWLAPLDEPTRLLEAAVSAGAVLLAGAYVLAIVNRWREGGPRNALYASAGVAGAAVFLGLGGLTGYALLGNGLLLVLGLICAAVGLVLAAIGFLAGAGGGGSAVLQAAVELFDSVVRTGSSVVSFARLAAFGLTHAALGWLVWSGTVALWRLGVLGAVAAVLLFLAGNALTFALEGLIAAVQALRLAFYELFSRIFVTEGRPFVPWHVPTRPVTGPSTQEVS
jgi:V/A-type H+/Na+-transporting ATPase subunit I